MKSLQQQQQLKKRQKKPLVLVLSTTTISLKVVIVFFGSLLFFYPFWVITFVPPPDDDNHGSSSHPVGNIFFSQQQQQHQQHDADDTVDVSLIGCLSPECIQKLGSQLARAFPDRSNHSTWCLPGSGSKQTKKGQNGLLLIKVPKSASSTSAGVFIRIAQKYHCGALQWEHRMAHEYSHLSLLQQHKNSLFVLTTVRDPAKRAISTIFFHVVSRMKNTKYKHTPIDDDFLVRHLRLFTHPHNGAVSEGQGGFTLRYIHPTFIPPYSVWTPNATTTTTTTTTTSTNHDDHTYHNTNYYRGKLLNAAATVEHVRTVIQNTYDFILVPERMDESLVALALLLNVDVGDVLVTSSKVSSSSSSSNKNNNNITTSYEYHLLHGPRNVYKCLAIQPSFVPSQTKQFLHSDEWRAMNYGDYLLHAAANASLEYTIQQTIGMSRFQSALLKYQTLKRLEQEQCAPHVQFPCSAQGEEQMDVAEKNCYLRFYDFGCGYPCIDRIIEEYNTNNNNNNKKKQT